MQVARHLIAHGTARADDFVFAPDGRLTDFCTGNLPGLLGDGVAFQTSGCPDCNRPFYNERPGGPLYNYARQLTQDEVKDALALLQEGLE